MESSVFLSDLLTAHEPESDRFMERAGVRGKGALGWRRPFVFELAREYCPKRLRKSRLSPSAARLLLCRGLGCALRRLNDRDGHGKTNLHDVVHEHFHVIDASRGKFDLREHSHVRGVMRGVLERELRVPPSNG